MKPDFRFLMNEATRLTRSGNLQAATAAIQAALHGDNPGASAAHDAGEIIDVEMREVADGAPSAADDAETSAHKQPQRKPREGQFISMHYGDGAAARDYKLYIPPGAGHRALPLVVMLHGCTQDPDDFAAGTQMNGAALAQDFFVLYPAQSRRANPQRCWNWFKHNHQGRGRGEPALLAGMTREVMSRYAVDRDRVYVAGLSAGAAMAAILGDTYPDLYAAVGVHSGLAAGAASDLPSAMTAMRAGGMNLRSEARGIPTIVFHGDADATVHPANGSQVIAATAGATAAVEQEHVRKPGERACTRQIHRALDGRIIAEHWLVHGGPHAWSGGSSLGSYTDEQGPDATSEMLRFFFEHPRRTTS